MLLWHRTGFEIFSLSAVSWCCCRDFSGEHKNGSAYQHHLKQQAAVKSKMRRFQPSNGRELITTTMATTVLMGLQPRWWQWIKKQLEDFIISKETELRLHPMKSEERRLAHIAARQLDLRSVSHGKDPNRYMVIKRSRACGSVFFCMSMNETQSLELMPEQLQSIQHLVKEFPVEPHHVEEHLTVPDLRRRNRRNGQSSFCNRSQRVVPARANMSPDMENFRVSLPTFRFREKVKRAIRSNKVTLITGGTGCGKSTQVPQFLLEDACSSNMPLRIVCTQPRRLPAIAVAKRVASERGERLGGTVGYHIRLEQKTSAETALTYCTSGVLLRMLTIDEMAQDITHIILDEIHEREQNTDYLLIALKQALRKRNDLKVILMSATMEGNLGTFMNYFDNHSVGFIDIPSRLFHVEKLNLAEVLAMTGYMPKSIFGGFFSPVDTWEDNGSSSTNNYDKFPTVGEFRSEERIDAGSFGQLNSNNNNHLHYSRPHDHYQQQHNDELITVKTAPNLFERRTLSPDTFGEETHENTFGFMKRRKNVLDLATKHLNRVMPHRPTSFQPQFVDVLRKSQLRHAALVKTYLNSGGQQWADGVDPDLTLELIRYLMDSPVEGSVLVFLPGYEDIITIRNQIASSFNQQSRPAASVRQGAWDSRKVILSTNIAEASLTIDDVVFVIDCGKVKEKTYDHTTRVSQLKVAWIAKSNAEQRSGRAGRCRAGYCFRLYSTTDYDNMLDTQVPEMKRAAIHDVSVEHSLEFLEQLGALYSEKQPIEASPSRFENARGASSSGHFNDGCKEPELTELGRVLAQLPLEPQLARLLLFGLALKCFNPVVTLVAALSHRDPFVLPAGEERTEALNARDGFGQRDFSDHLMLMRAFYAYTATAPSQQYQFCRSKFLSPTAMKMIHGIRRQLMMELKRLHLLPPSGAIVAGCYPGIGFVKAGSKLRKIRTNTDVNASLHPSSVLKRQVMSANKNNGGEGFEHEPVIEYLAYQELAKIDEGLTLRMVTVVPPLTVLLFAGPIRTTKEVIENFEIAEEDISTELIQEELTEEEEARKKLMAQLGISDPNPTIPKISQSSNGRRAQDHNPLEDPPEYVLELESWLAFKADVLLSGCAQKSVEGLEGCSSQDQCLLECLNQVLTMDHQKNYFKPCKDLPSSQQQQRPKYSSYQTNYSATMPNHTQGTSDYRKSNNYSSQQGWTNGSTSNGNSKRPQQFGRTEYYHSQRFNNSARSSTD
uniref:RNA helicase n=1 Tax=Ditylenchus dipsaci TaxID=166011 RepID=A0A915DEP9_9BILA